MSRVDPGPEHEAKHAISEWLERHGGRVWWEETNAWDYDLFSIDRGGDTPPGGPDLVVEIGGYVFVIEFKAGESKSEIYDSLLQLHGYWLDHLVHDQTYIVEDRSISVDGFLTASKHSQFGRVFPPYAEGDIQTLETMGERRATCVKYNQLPRSEYPMTEQHVRTLWRLGNQALNNFVGADNGTHLGVLLSDHLETPQLDPVPAVLWNRGRVNQSWEVLG